MKSSTVLLYAKRKTPAAMAARDMLKDWLQKKKIDTVDVTDSQDPIRSDATKSVALGVVIGGDGTFLRLVRRLEKKDGFPILGVNLGSLGFITEVSREDMIAAAEDALAGKYKEEKRPLLEVELKRGGKRIEFGHVFNDSVLTKDARTTMLKFDVRVDGELLSYVRADGYVISTATGSTAYNLSCGGPILHPQLASMVLVPICSHSLSARPIVIPQHCRVELLLHEFNGGAYLVYDGQVNFEIKPGDQINVRASEDSLRLIRSPRQNWSEALRSKLEMT